MALQYMLLDILQEATLDRKKERAAVPPPYEALLVCQNRRYHLLGHSLDIPLGLVHHHSPRLYINYGTRTFGKDLHWALLEP